VIYLVRWTSLRPRFAVDRDRTLRPSRPVRTHYQHEELWGGVSVDDVRRRANAVGIPAAAEVVEHGERYILPIREIP